jgi:hypothetical protein
MISPDRRVRMLLCCATDGGDPVIAEVVHNLRADCPVPLVTRFGWDGVR